MALVYYTGDTRDYKVPLKKKNYAGVESAYVIPNGAVVTATFRLAKDGGYADKVAGPWTCDKNHPDADWDIGEVIVTVDGETTKTIAPGIVFLEVQISLGGKQTAVAKQAITVLQDTCP